MPQFDVSRLQELRRSAIKLIRDAEFGECGCYDCIMARKQEVSSQAAALMYPSLVFLPKRFKSIQMNEELIRYLYSLRIENNDIREQVDTVDHQLGRDRTSLTYCRNCGKLHERPTLINSEPFCQACVNELIVCSNCKELVPLSHTRNCRIDSKKGKICTDCVPLFSACNNCGLTVPKTEITKYIFARDSRGDFEYRYVCKECEDRDSFICPMCSCTSHRVVGGRGNHNETICPSCAEEMVGQHEYYYKPLKLYFQSSTSEGTVTQDAFHMGIEIETARMSSSIDEFGMAHLLKERYGSKHIYCMHDGTISDSTGSRGTEVVSHPFTWQYYKNNIGMWDDLLLFLRSKGWKSNLRGIGFHVHTTKAAWGSYQIYKLLELIYNNIPWVCSVAQRKPTSYCVMSQKDFDSAVLVAKNKKNRRADHYAAINLNTGTGLSSSTIEFRMFQGSLEPLFFHKNIEFVRACYEFTRKHKRMIVSEFNKFVINNRRIYPCLNEFMTNYKGGI